jgi:hypothetical protein
MRELFAISRLFSVVDKECMINGHSMLYELAVVWHTISFKQRQTLGMSPVEFRRDVKFF